MYTENWLCCVRKPRRDSFKLATSEGKSSHVCVKGCSSTLRTSAGCVFDVPHPLFTWGILEKGGVGMTSLGYLIPTQNRVFSPATSGDFVRPARRTPGLTDLWGFCWM